MRIDEEGEGVSASRNHLVFAYYVTGHGFGHATRVVEVDFSHADRFFLLFFFCSSLNVDCPLAADQRRML